ncbi:MAG: NADH-quinone oxidoreductase subunit L [Pseudomonadales bacterium]|jgi:NADH-quinone oxidoreductase subunit L|nr:NADH-quinone oxidoreductase subunit L [Pseudomonadales bacterium]
MLEYLWLVPAIPLIGSLILVLSQGKLPELPAAIVGAGSIGLAFLVALLAGMEFLSSGDVAYTQHLWTWMAVGGFSADFNLYLDGVALVMMLVITGIGFLIHVYATGYMHDDPSFARFFSYMNLFVSAMLILVLGDNLLLLFMGWEGVGLCSYLLIGFWYTDTYNGYCARKAFVITRVGDASMALGLFLLYTSVHTINIQDAMGVAQQQWTVSSSVANWVTLLLLGGAVGKSAQLPLQTWLPDAMAGPTPISALIHAATMVTAGVYLIARTHVLYEMAPSVQYLVGLIGAITLLMAGFTALTQSDIKKVLAFSTMSQIGYMFLALGVGAYSSAIFHLMTHAFFKALLFLTAGSIILAMHHEQNIFKMGGLRKDLPWSHALFLIGTIALVALPPTSGFFSKEEILGSALMHEDGGFLLWLFGIAGAFMTGLYSFRLYFLVFWGKKTHDGHEVMGLHLQGPLVILAILALVGGWIVIPVAAVFPHGEEHHVPLFYQAIMLALPILGTLTAYFVFVQQRVDVKALAGEGFGARLHHFWRTQWGMDWLYDQVFAKPYATLARINKNDFIDSIYNGTARFAVLMHSLVSDTQTGQLRWYAITLASGVLLLVTIGVLV